MLETLIDDRAPRLLYADIETELADNGPRAAIAAGVIAASTEHRFATGDDGRWKDVTPQTRRRRKGDKTAPPLTDLGGMRNAATATRDGVAHSAFRVEPTGLTMGVTGLPGAPALQKDRPFMVITPEDEAAIVGGYEARLAERFGGHP